MDQKVVNLAQERISNEEFIAWRNDRTTQKIIARMDLTVEQIKHSWYNGRFKDEVSQDGVSNRGQNDYWMGFANGIHEFIRIAVDDEGQGDDE